MLQNKQMQQTSGGPCLEVTRALRAHLLYYKSPFAADLSVLHTHDHGSWTTWVILVLLAMPSLASATLASEAPECGCDVASLVSGDVSILYERDRPLVLARFDPASLAKREEQEMDVPQLK